MFKTGYVKIPPQNTATLKIPFVEERKGARGGCDLYDHPNCCFEPCSVCEPACNESLVPLREQV